MTQASEILNDFWKALEKSPFMMLGIPAQSAHSQPMTAKFDGNRPGTIWFFTKSDNRLIEGLAASPQAMAQFASQDHDLYACAAGNLAIETERTLVDKFWSDGVANWYDGKDDPDLVLLRFELTSGEFWENDISAGGTLKLLFGGELQRKDIETSHLETAM